ncbi:zinc finger and SCAN domain-containing protein 2-like [Cheilinus undulatus]|uniref:zinc finger and SCAN domain-containing protein 2-like n=1 Tax=Cheilinus undulatus TaxID=241271 RepID=UPI001BD2E098|nr:zinc finger and SCAN domain-containing protein 2-like [Cheilinus undulatus]
MSTVQILRCLVNQRLTAAAEEVFEMFERTIADYEEKLRRSREENHRQQKLLSAVYNPEIHLDTAEVEQLMVRKEEVLPEQQERSSSLIQEITEPPLIKEEQEDLWRGQDREQLQQAEEEDNLFTPISVKSEEEDEEEPQSSQSCQTQPEESRDTGLLKTDAGGEECGESEADRDFIPDWYFLPTTPDKPSHLFRPDTYQSGDWGESDEPQEGLNPLQNKGVAVNIPVTFNTLNTSVSSSECSPNIGQKKQKRKEKGEKPYSCSVCGKSYPGKNNLKEHMLRHAAEKPFSCSVCNRSFIKKTELVTHMRSHTGEKPYQCSVCGKRFTQSGSLTTHFVIHSGVKPFSCSVCGKSFSQRGGLKQHSAVHTTEKLFSCSFCENTFQSRADFVKHMRAHAVEKPFSCSVCGKGFYQYCNMKQHEVMHIRESVQLEGLS